MSQFTKKYKTADSGGCVGERIARTTNFCRDEIIPMVMVMVLGSSHGARRNATKILASWGCVALAVVLFSQPCSSGQRLIEMRDWTLPQFVDHLNAHGLTLYVVPTHKSGTWSNSVFLTLDPQATWLSLQHNSRSVERIDEWQGVVLVEKMSSKPGPKWDVSQWGEHGLQIDRFVLFGDADLIRQIGQSALISSQSHCALSRWLCLN